MVTYLQLKALSTRLISIPAGSYWISWRRNSNWWSISRHSSVTYSSHKEILSNIFWILSGKYQLIYSLYGNSLNSNTTRCSSGLNKPANTLFRHNLTGVLEAAIRSSNAQYDDPSILARLDVRLLEVSWHMLSHCVFLLYLLKSCVQLSDITSRSRLGCVHPWLPRWFSHQHHLYSILYATVP
jgi:hypothetical protein